MRPDEHLLIVGASARAAAFSALRAGLRPWCVDLFADADLRARCPARKLQGRYPAGFMDVVAEGVPGPWMYTGGLENHPGLIARMARRRPLWGNGADVLRAARDPARLASAAREAGLPAPALEMRPGTGRWLVKPRGGAGGHGVRFLAEGESAIPEKHYLQQYIAGPSASAVFAGPALLGVTRQLVGEGFLRAPAFRYCGSVGPLLLESGLLQRIKTLGEVLVSRLGLRGLFGVDGVLCDGAFWPVELNPRYPASVEVLERATGLRALALHAEAFDPDWRAGGVSPRSASTSGDSPPPLTGKAILYARADVAFPAIGPWSHAIDFADLPHPGDVIEAGRPILTIFADGADEVACLSALRGRAAEVEACLYAGG
jgi:predicted ATP-grasp superfamily ATP-dependent carboligase